MAAAAHCSQAADPDPETRSLEQWMEREMTSYQRKSNLIAEVEAYLAFYAILNPIVAPPRVEVNSRRMIRRIDQYGIRADLLREES